MTLYGNLEFGTTLAPVVACFQVVRDPMLTDNQQGPVTFVWGNFTRDISANNHKM